MKVLMIEPGKVPYETEIENSLRAMQAAVGGKIQTVEFSDDPAVIICNREGKMKGMPLNRPLHDSKGEVYDIIAGKFFIAGAGEEDFCDLPDSLMKKYEEEFHHPKQFKRVAGRVLIMNQKEESPLSEYQGDKEIRLRESNHLAFEVDTFLRKNSQAYDEMYSDPQAEIEQIAQNLFDGKTWKVRMCMATAVQEEYLAEEAEPLHKMISDYEQKYGINIYSIYQLNLSDSTDPYRFMPFSWLQEKGLSVERGNYQMVYSAELTPGDTLHTIFEDLNLYHPADYKGHSLSVSDIVVFNEYGQERAWYVDSIGFKELPDFFKRDGQEKENNRSPSVKEQLDKTKMQAAQTEKKETVQKTRTPGRG